jgi:hypothetical protein
MSPRYISMLLLAVLAISGCGGGGTPEPKFAVQRVTPAAGATSVEKNCVITVAFNKKIDARTVDAAVFVVKDADGEIVSPSEIVVDGAEIRFSPSVKLYGGREYSVLVSSAVGAVSGEHLANDFTSRFTTRESAWSESEQIGESNQARTALSRSGGAVTVWWRYNYDNRHYEIVMSQYDGSTWTEPRVISGNSTAVYSPTVAMDSRGDAIIAWIDWGDFTTTGGVVFTEFRNGEWSQPRFVNTIPFMSSSPPSVAMSDSGRAIITWQRSGIYKIEYANGEWSDETLVAAESYAQEPVAKMNASGKALIAWRYDRGTSSGNAVYCTESQGGVWTAPHVVSLVGDRLDYHRVALSDNGDAVMVWQQREGLTYRIYLNEYREGTWLGPVGISQAGAEVYYPRAAIDGAGNWIVVWQEQVGAVWQVFVLQSKNGSWLSSTAGSFSRMATIPHIEMDNSGNAILLWNEADGADWQLYRRQYLNGTWSGDSLVAVSHNELNNISCDVAMDGTGDAVLVWDELDRNARIKLFRSRFY